MPVRIYTSCFLLHSPPCSAPRLSKSHSPLSLSAPLGAPLPRESLVQNNFCTLPLDWPECTASPAKENMKREVKFPYVASSPPEYDYIQQALQQKKVRKPLALLTSLLVYEVEASVLEPATNRNYFSDLRRLSSASAPPPSSLSSLTARRALA